MRPWTAALAAASFSVVVASSPLPVIVAGRVVFRVVDPGPYGTLAARVQAIDQQICEAISREDVGKPNMIVVQRGGLWSVFIGKTFLVSVYAGDAKLYGQPPKKVAELWAARLKEAFPLVQPLGQMTDKSVATRLDRPLATAQTRPVKVPPEHWGIVNTYMLLLWKAREVSRETQAEDDLRLAAEIIEDAARHYLAPPVAGGGHEPGTCPSLRTCRDCQAVMAAALAVEEDKRDVATALAGALASDEQATRAVRQAFEYVRHIDQPRFMAERVRMAWQLWQRLAARAARLCPSLEAVQAPAAATPGEAKAAGA